MKPYWSDGKRTIFHGNCREILPTLPKADLCLTDPPYGIALDTDNSRFSGGSPESVARRARVGSRAEIGPSCGAPVIGDEKDFDPSFLLAHGENHIIWGWHNFPNLLPRGTCLVWLKRNEQAFGSFLSDAETAWKSQGHGVYCHLEMSCPSAHNVRVHPTQKPLGLMKWCLSFFPKAQSVIDPFMGSGTTLRACKDLGIACIGIELEEKYCEIAVNRLLQDTFEFEEVSNVQELPAGIQGNLLAEMETSQSP